MDLQKLLDFHHQCNEESRQMDSEMESILQTKKNENQMRVRREGAVAYLQQQWLTSKDVEQSLRISTRKLQTMRNSGQIPFSKLGGDIYYRMQDVEELLIRGLRTGAEERED